MGTLKPVLHHITIKTARLAEMVAWYATVIGAHVQFQDAGAAWMTNDAANHRLGFLALPGLTDDPGKNAHSGMHHTAFEYASFEDLMASFHRLRGEHIAPAFCLDHGLTLSLYYADPDGNHVELQCDSFGDWKQSGAFMRTSPEFARDPIGTFFDPAKVYDAHVAGRPFASLQPAIRAGEFVPAVMPKLA